MESALNLGIHTGQVEAGTEDLRVLSLPRSRVEQTALAVVAIDVRLIPSRLGRAGRADVAAKLDLIAVHVGQHEAVRREWLRVDLDVFVLQQRLVERARAGGGQRRGKQIDVVSGE